MTSDSARTIFAVSCLLCLVAIATGAAIEIVRQKRGESLLRPSHFRLRIFSALVWMISLGSLAYAVAFLWPQSSLVFVQRRQQAEEFLSVISGGMLLLVIGIFLLAYDMWQVWRERRVRESQFNLQLLDMARMEIEKAQRDQAQNGQTLKVDEAP